MTFGLPKMSRNGQNALFWILIIVSLIMLLATIPITHAIQLEGESLQRLVTIGLLIWVLIQSVKNAMAVHGVHLEMNSRLDQLIEEIRINVLAKGIKEGRRQVEEEQKIKDKDKE